MTESHSDQALKCLAAVPALLSDLNNDMVGTSADEMAAAVAIVGLTATTGVGYAVLECGGALQNLVSRADAQLIATVLTTRCIPLNRQEEQQLENKLRAHLGIGGAVRD